MRLLAPETLDETSNFLLLFSFPKCRPLSDSRDSSYSELDAGRPKFGSNLDLEHPYFADEKTPMFPRA